MKLPKFNQKNISNCLFLLLLFVTFAAAIRKRLRVKKTLYYEKHHNLGETNPFHSTALLRYATRFVRRWQAQHR